MWSPLLLHCTWWLINKKAAMVDYEINMQGWLEDATLFPAEPSDHGFNFNDILSSGGKANDDAALDADLPDLDWLDAQADLSILDDPKGLIFQPFETADPLNLDNAANFLLGLIDSNLDTSYLSSDISKNELNDILNASAQMEQQTSEVTDFNLPSPYCESVSEVGSPEVAEFVLPSPFYESISEAGSPVSHPDVCQSPSSSLDDGGYETAASPSNSGIVSVTVCEVDTSPDPLKTLSIDEVSHSVRRRRYINDGKDIPKVHVKNVFHPYAKTSSKRSGSKNERKKVQNKEAAARYRVKKRNEEQELSGVVEGLEKEQDELRKKHDGLMSEIKYLKSLMVEVLQKKGVL